jgi:hypothetical protein
MLDFQHTGIRPAGRYTPIVRPVLSGQLFRKSRALRWRTADPGPRGACQTTTERLVVSTQLDTGPQISELRNLTPKSFCWQQRQVRRKGKFGVARKKGKVHVVPIANPVHAMRKHRAALENAFPLKKRRTQDIVKVVANRTGIARDVSSQRLCRTFATMALPKGTPPRDRAEDPGP